MRDPDTFAHILDSKYKHKLKGTVGISFHLGCDLFQEEDATLYISPRKYAKKMVDGYVNMFKQNHKMK